MKPTLRHILVLVAFAVIVGCGGKKSKTTVTDSAGFMTLGEKKAFLEQYVNFRRNYEELEFDVTFIDGGDGRVPGPTEWDIRVSAKVPADDINDWISGMTQTKSADTSWVSSIPNAPIKLDAFQWYEDGRRLVGSSVADCIVLYRNFAN
ncbi:MAG: hypothetical protein P1U82_28170 [Verrucomicrobiales bacterium]|jgi:hypothetical protein|nr:hypothetical protein [Verrucomicrobiales bacterium]MDB2327403.1 hypothetical protein [bacterium]MDF1789770.1 hypothetical protein [Verrucomicrobiales bacterium]